MLIFFFTCVNRILNRSIAGISNKPNQHTTDDQKTEELYGVFRFFFFLRNRINISLFYKKELFHRCWNFYFFFFAVISFDFFFFGFINLQRSPCGSLKSRRDRLSRTPRPEWCHRRFVVDEFRVPHNSDSSLSLTRPAIYFPFTHFFFRAKKVDMSHEKFKISPKNIG